MMVATHENPPAPQEPFKKGKAIKLARSVLKKLSEHYEHAEIVDVVTRKSGTVRKVVVGVSVKESRTTPTSRVARIVYKGLPLELVIY